MSLGTTLADMAQCCFRPHPQSFNGDGDAAAQAATKSSAIHATQRSADGIEFKLIARSFGESQGSFQIIDASINLAPHIFVGLAQGKSRLDMRAELTLAEHQLIAQHAKLH